jgi:hypothetical protein
VEPQLERAIDTLKQKKQSCHEWTMLYTPLVKSLFSAFTHTLELRRTALCTEVHGVLTKSDTTSSQQGVSLLPIVLGGLAGRLGSDIVTLSSTEVAAELSSTAPALHTPADPTVAYESMRKTLDSFNAD